MAIRLATGVCLALALVPGLAATPASAQVVRTVGRVLVTSGVEGRFADPVCRDDVTLSPAPFARHASTLAAAAGQSDRPLLLDAGDLLSPFGVARWAAADDPEGLAELVANLGYRAIALGTLDLAAPRAALIAVLRALRDRGVPTIATNLRCDARAAALCDVLVDGSDGIATFRFGDRRAAVVSLVDPAAVAVVAPERLEGIRIFDPAETLASAVRIARERSLFAVATVAFAPRVSPVAGASSRENPTTAALDLVRSLPVDDRPNLLVVAGAGAQFSFARPADFRPALVAPPAGGVLEVRVRESLLSDAYDMFALATEPKDVPGLAVLDWIDRVGPSYCAALGDPLPGGRLVDGALDADGFTRLAAGAIRAEHATDIAVLHARVVEPSWAPARSDTLSASDVFVALRFDEPLVRADVGVAWLRALMARTTVIPLGVRGTGDDLRVLGRAPVPGARYSVVTTRFAAQVLLAALPDPPDWQPTGEHLRETVRRWLERPRDLDPRRAMRRPEDGVEWTAKLTLDATFDGTQVSNPGSNYEASLLTGASNLSFGGRFRLSLDAVAPVWSWENDVDVRYTVNDTPSGTTNPTDLVQYTTSIVYRGLRGEGAPPSVPEAYVENLFETEFTTPAQDAPDDPTARDFYRLFDRPSIGLRFPLAAKLDLKAGFSTELERVSRRGELATDVRPGLNAQLKLASWTLLEDGDRRVTWGFRLDANVSSWLDPGSRTTQLRGTSDLELVIVGPFGLKLTYDLFAQKDARVDWGVYTRGLVSLTVAWVGRTARW